MVEALDYRKTVNRIVEIKDFSRCQRNFIVNDVVDDEDVGLQIKIYPCNNDYVSVYITKEDDKKPLVEFKALCFVNVIDAEKSFRFSQSFAYNHEDGSDVFIFGLEKCFNRKYLLGRPDDFLPVDTLFLYFEIHYQGKNISQVLRRKFVGQKLKEIAEKLDEQRVCEREETACKLSNEINLIKRCFLFFSSINYSPKYTETVPKYKTQDDILVVKTRDNSLHEISFKGGTRSLGNKLCLESPVFHRMLLTDCLETNTNQINIEDFDSSTMSTFLHYLRTGKLKLPDNICETYLLYEFADKYNVLKLMDACSRFFSEHLNNENVVDISMLSVLHSDTILMKSIASYFRAKGILLIGKINITTLNDLLKNLRLRTDIPEPNLCIKHISHTNHLNKHVLLINQFEEVCVLYEIASQNQVCDMIEECARFLKQTITNADIPTLINLVKRIHSPADTKYFLGYVNQESNRHPSVLIDIILNMNSKSSEIANQLATIDHMSHIEEFEFYH